MKLSLENSFASHEKSIYWFDKNQLKPHEVSKCSGKNIYLLVIVNMILKVHWIK